jgi:hypothetical protein
VNIEPISNGNLRIWLAEEEIREWGLEDGDGGGVRRLVRRALSAVGRRPAARMCAEMIPVEGGCVLLVSTEVHNRRLPTVFVVTGEDALLEVYARWHPQWGSAAHVYAVGEDYHVLLYSEEGESLLREYGHRLGCGEGMAAHTAEYGCWVGEITAPAPAPPTREDRVR